MKQKRTIGFAILAIAIILILSIGITIAVREATAAEIQDEITFVRMTTALSRGNDSNNKVNINTLGQELDKYAGIGKTSVTQKSSTTLLIIFTETGNEYEIDVDRGFEALPVTYYLDEETSYTEIIAVGDSVLEPKTFTTPTKEGWTFIGWREDTIADSNVLEEKILEGSPIALYAIYEKEVTLTYDGNGATGGSTESQSGIRYFNASGNYQDPTFTLSECGFTRTNYAFNGWNLGAAGEKITLTVDTTAEAFWKLTTLNLMTDITWKHGTVKVGDYSIQDAMTFSSSRIYMTYGWANESGGGSRGGHYGQTTSFDITDFKTLKTKISHGTLGYNPEWGDTLTHYVRLYYDGGFINLGSSSYDVSSYTGNAYIYVYGAANGCGGSTTIEQLTLST